MSSPFKKLDVGALHLDVPFGLGERDSQDLMATISVDLQLFRTTDHRLQSTQARRAMETLASRHHATPPVRVATLPPSGRPIALQAGDKAAVQVSASHAGGLVVVACRDGLAGVGVDLVEPASAGHGLDWWTCGDGACDTAEDRPRLWAAREAAYKAAVLDAPFVPANVEVRLDGPSFFWRINHSQSPIAGEGRFFSAAHCLLAVAVEQRAVTVPRCSPEAAVCL